MSTSREFGLVIKSIDYDDNDKIITILTSNSLLTFIAKGVRKVTSKNSYALQLGNLVEVEYFKARLTGKISKLKKATLIKQLPLKESDTALVWLNLLKTFNKMTEGSEKLFNAVIKTYESFGDKYNHFAKTYIMFNYLSSQGVEPNINSCVECNRKDMITNFDFAAGGFLCHLHSKHERSVEFLKGINLLNNFDEYKLINPKINTDIYLEIQNYLKTIEY